MMNLRARRIEQEWLLLERLASANPSIVCTVAREKQGFEVNLRESPAWTQGTSGPRIRMNHTVHYMVPRFYPSLPVEGYLARPVFHPNVDQVSGFLCLWSDYQPRQTIVDALQITRAILAHHCFNLHPDHCMQPDALGCEALPMSPLLIPESCRTDTLAGRANARPRLTPLHVSLSDLEISCDI